MSRVSAEDVVRSLFNPGEIVHLRIFDDKKTGTFAGMKIAIEAGKLPTVMDQLKKHNAMNRGIFFVVNAGGDDDKSITRINAQFVECDDLPMEEQIRQAEAFPLPPPMEIKPLVLSIPTGSLRMEMSRSFVRSRRRWLRSSMGIPCASMSRVSCACRASITARPIR